ncbi:MAG: 3'-5' exonuclease, partial [Vicinamibacterales bacterium]
MTTHAAKGLEFPMVFVVNMHRGSGGSLDAIRVVPPPFGRDDGVEPSVAIGEHETDADRDIEAREAEEGKRLLYVALTRARDRLYLATTLNGEGRFAPFKGGLGRALPPSLAAIVAAAHTTLDPVISWSGTSGLHRFRILRPSPQMTDAPAPASAAPDRLDDFSPLTSTAAVRIAATELAPDAPELGLLVHRAIQAGLLGREGDQHTTLDRLLRDDERAVIENVPLLVERAIAALAILRARPDVMELFSERTAVVWRRHEVPFSLRRADAAIVRGSIDCLVMRENGLIHVLGFKTGRPDPAHQLQLDVYLAAARMLFPGAPVEGHLIYV